MDEKYSNVLRQLLPENESDIINLQRLDSLSDRRKPRIVVCGTYNSGKSSLLNALTGHYEKEYFRVNDIPETREEACFDNGHSIYVDTPGLDVNEQDDRVTRSGVAAADIVLLVHRLSAGSLQDDDIRIFRQLIAAQVNVENVLVVLTGAEQQQENSGLIQEITDLMAGMLNDRAQIFLVSNPRYLKGMRESKHKLVEASGIPALVARLEQRSAELLATLAQERKARRSQIITTLLAAATRLQQTTQKNLAKKVSATARQQKKFVADVQGLKQELAEKVAGLNKLAGGQ